MVLYTIYEVRARKSKIVSNVFDTILTFCYLFLAVKAIRGTIEDCFLMEIYNWSEVAPERVMPTQTRKVIHTPKTTIVQVTSQKGTVVPLHHHVHEQVTLLVSGAFHYELEDRSVELRPGDVLRIPSDVPHLAEALEDSVTLEVFVPAREDWIRDQQEAKK